MRTADYQKPNLRYNLKYSQRVCQKNKEKKWGVELLWAEPDADRFSSPEPSLVSIIALGKKGSLFHEFESRREKTSRSRTNPLENRNPWNS